MTATSKNLAGKRVLVMGLGRFGGGVGVTRFLAARARVLVTDKLAPEKLAGSVKALADLQVDYRLGTHEERDFTQADLVVVNPAVDPRGNPYLEAAQRAGVALTSEIRLLVAHLPPGTRVIGITGSAGKSTTTAMIGHILRKHLGEERVHIGGNLGGSLLDRVERIASHHWVVLELSSFMLEGLAQDRWSPHVAVVTNLNPNHLDRHGTLEGYRAAKQTLLDWQRPLVDKAVLGPKLRGVFHPQVPWVLHREMDGLVRPPAAALLVPGAHNRLNAAMALDAVDAAIGLPWDRAAGHLADFAGLPHRLQMVCEHGGVRYFNDSKSTTPESAMLALESFPAGVVHAIFGGSDKGSDFSAMAAQAARHCRGVYTIGVTGDRIADAAERAGAGTGRPSTCGGVAGWSNDGARVQRCGTLEQALLAMTTQLHRGDVVLLSPGCASLDQFENYEQRGAKFVELVLKYTGEGGMMPG